MVLDEFKLSGEVAVLTGCGRSWFGQLAAALMEAGATVVIAGSEQQISSVTKDMPKIIGMPTDLTSSQDVLNMTQQTISRYGSIDILVNNMNLELGKPFLEMSEGEWQRMMDANLTSTFLCCKTIGRYMLGQKKGRIVNVVPGASVRGISNGAAYCASMGGVIQLTRALALEWSRENVRVNAVGVGWMEDAFDGAQGDPIARYVPMRRRGRPSDIAPLVVFLASRASSYLSGQLYFVDGGLMARA
jgi:NAD(P)-dependent dehydrogenase (short-subunit alcohol dehydrogenase family)